MVSGGLLGKAHPFQGLAASDTAAAGIAPLATDLSRHWLPVGRVEELPEVGSYFTWERTGIPSLFVRSIDGEIRGFYNSCRHRGAPVVRTATGRSRAFRCQYHSWTYDSYGRLLSIPDERDFGDIDRCTHGLIPLPTIECGGWLWANPDGSAADEIAPLASYEPMAELHSTLIFQGRATYILDADWARVQSEVKRISSEPNIAPNLAFYQSGDGCCLLAIWPRDDWRLTVEVVNCGSASTAGDGANAQQFLDQFIANIGASGC